MKLSVVTTTPEVPAPVPVALLRGTFAERLEKAVHLGCGAAVKTACVKIHYRLYAALSGKQGIPCLRCAETE